MLAAKDLLRLVSFALVASCAKPEVPALGVTPLAGSLVTGQTTQLTVTRQFPEGPAELVTDRVRYNTSNKNAATVSATGAVLAGAEIGQVSIRIDDPQSEATATVSFSVVHGPASNLLAVVVAPNPASVAIGGALQFSARGVFEDGSLRDLTPLVGWSSSTPAVATITGAGLAAGVDAGATTITASAPSTIGALLVDAGAHDTGDAGGADAGGAGPAAVISGSAAATVR